MKPREFRKVMQDFVEDDKRWRALQIGDIIYEELCAGMEFEYAKMIIKKIDLEEREVIAYDANSDVKFNYKALNDFLTKEEYDRMFNPLIKN